MKEIVYTITDPNGMHARPAGLFAKEAAKFSSKITLEADKGTVDAKGIFALMGLGVKSGETIKIKIDGPDETDAGITLSEFLKNNL
ncbi:MAG: HPr family phosphocarrier protein [Clostridia bacterium]|nr:HPr family phosphocarrier protein [Clostridia bacterium]